MLKLKLQYFERADSLEKTTENKIFHVSEEEFVATLRREREIIEANGLFVNQTHGAWRWPAQDFSEYDRAERYAAMEKGVRGTALLGAPYFVIHCIMPFGENNPAHKEELWQMNVEYFSRLCKVAEEVGVTICFEPMTPSEIIWASGCGTM